MREDAFLTRLKKGAAVQKTLKTISESPLKNLTIQESQLLNTGINMLLIGLVADLQSKGYLTMDGVEQLIRGEEQ